MIKRPLEIYRLMIRAVFATNGCQRIANDSAAHAAILIEEIVGHALQSIDVVCHSLSMDVWGLSSVRQAVERAIRERRVRVRIVVTDQQVCRENVAHYRDIGATVQFFHRPDFCVNFLIADGRYFRVEPDCSVRKGFAYINKPDWAAELTADFERIYGLAQSA